MSDVLSDFIRDAEEDGARRRERTMANEKRWRQLSGGTFYKFEETGQVLEGIWLGTKSGKFGDNGMVEVLGEVKLFSLNTALKDLMRVKPGAEVRIEYMGKQTSKGGNEFKAYTVLVADGAEVADPDEDGTPF